MKARAYSIFIGLVLSAFSVVSQETPTSDEALNIYNAISEIMDKSFPEDDMKTFSRESFSEAQLETYLSQHFQRMDMLPFIEGQHTLKLDGYLHSGNWFKAMRLPTQSNNAYKLFFDYYNKCNKELNNAEKIHYAMMISFAYSHLAENYAKLSLLDSAAIQHRNNIKFMKAYNVVSYPSALNNFGLFYYWDKKELDSALVYFNQGFEYTNKHFPKHYLLGSIRDNIADVNVDLKNLTVAESLYKDNFEFYKYNTHMGVIDVPRLVSAGAQLVATNLKLGHTAAAKFNFKQLEAVVYTKANRIETFPNAWLEFLKTKELIYNLNKDAANAYKTLQLYHRYSDSLRALTTTIDNNWDAVINNISLDRVKLKYEIDQIQKENKIKSQKSRLLITTLISSLFIILLLSIILRRRQHLINAKNQQLIVEQNLENSKLKVEQLHSEIKSKERDLSDFAINLIQNQEWASSLADKIEVYKAAESSQKKELLNDLEQDIKNKITFDQDTQVFFERLDKLSDAFYSHLITDYPNLSKNEIQLCSLIRLKMDSRNIATLQNITLASLNTSRYRLRKKLDLSDDVNLDDFIQRL